GLRWSKARSRSQAMPSNSARADAGRCERGSRQSMPAAWKARTALRTVCVAQPRLSAIWAGGRPLALAKTVCARRRVKAWGERRPAWIACRSESSRGRTKVGGFIQPMMRRTRRLHKITLETALVFDEEHALYGTRPPISAPLQQIRVDAEGVHLQV